MTQTIYKIDANSYFVGESLEIEDWEGCPPGWVRGFPPEEVSQNRYAVFKDGFWTYTEEPPPVIPEPVPFKVHKFWLTKVLEALGEIDAVEDALDDLAAAGNRIPRRDWQNATEIERANQLLNEFATSRGYTSEQLDQMFRQAAEYQRVAESNM